jgi:hypothetical protein
MTPRIRRKLERVYGLMLAHDHEYGNEPYQDEAMALVVAVIGKRSSVRVERQIEQEYAGSGMETTEEDDE